MSDQTPTLGKSAVANMLECAERDGATGVCRADARFIAAYVSELEADCDRCHALLDERMDRLAARASATEAESARLREALNAVVEEYPYASGMSRGIDGDNEGYGSIRRARAALSTTPGEQA